MLLAQEAVAAPREERQGPSNGERCCVGGRARWTGSAGDRVILMAVAGSHWRL